MPYHIGQDGKIYGRTMFQRGYFSPRKIAQTKEEAEQMYVEYKENKEAKRAFRRYFYQVEIYIKNAAAHEKIPFDFTTYKALAEDAFAFYGPCPEVIMATQFVGKL